MGLLECNMKITRKNLLDIIKEEFDGVISEQGTVDGQPVTLGGQQVTREELIKTSFDKIEEAINSLGVLKNQLKKDFQNKIDQSSGEIEDDLELENIQDLIELIKGRAIAMGSRMRGVLVNEVPN